MTEQDLALHRQLEQRTKAAIGWGVSGYVHYQLRFSPYTFAYLVDGSGVHAGTVIDGVPVISPSQLNALNPADYVVVILAEWTRFGAEITAQANAAGFFAIAPAVSSELPTTFSHQQLQTAFTQLAQDYPARTDSLQKQAVLYIQGLVKGGAERQMILLAQGLIERGYQVHLVCQSPDHPATLSWQQQLQHFDVQRHFFSAPKHLWQHQPPTPEELQVLSLFAPFLRVRGLHNILCMQRLLNALKPELFVSYLDDGNLSSAVAGIWARQPKTLLSCRNTRPDQHCDLANQDFYICPFKALKAWYQTFSQQSRLQVYHNSQFGADSYSQWLCNTQLEAPVVRNAVMPSPPTHSKPTLRERLHIGQETFLLTAIMRCSMEKNPTGFIELIASLQNRCAVYGILVGDGPQMSQVRDLIKQRQLSDHIYLAGMQDDTQIFYQQSDLIVIPSHQEGMPNVLMEAFAAACPVVSTKAGEAEYILRPRFAELLVAIDDPKQLTATVHKTLTQLAVYKQRFADAHADFLNQFSVQTLAQNTLDLNSATRTTATRPQGAY